MRRLYREHHQLAALLGDLESGIITMSFNQYQRMPAILKDAWMLLKQIRAERVQDHP